MSSNEQEQEDELQSLEAIYEADFAREGAAALRVRIAPAAGDGAAKAWVGCTLRCAFAAGYPASAPAALSLCDVVGLTEAQLGELEGLVGAAALELLGAPCVYSVVESVREWLNAHNEKPSDGSAFDEMMRNKRAAEAAAAGGGAGGGGGALSRELDPSIKKKAAEYVEEDEGVRRRRDGTPVTPESFKKWRDGFEAEMQRAREEAAEKKRCVLSGRPRRRGLAASRS